MHTNISKYNLLQIKLCSKSLLCFSYLPNILNEWRTEHSVWFKLKRCCSWIFLCAKGRKPKKTLKLRNNYSGKSLQSPVVAKMFPMRRLESLRTFTMPRMLQENWRAWQHSWIFSVAEHPGKRRKMPKNLQQSKYMEFTALLLRYFAFRSSTETPRYESRAPAFRIKSMQASLSKVIRLAALWMKPYDDWHAAFPE